MEALRIIFMGTPEFAVGILDMLVKKEYTVVGVITAPDRPSGRGRKLNESAVKTYAIAKNIRVLQPTNLKDENFLENLKSLNANLQIVVAFRMLPKVVWKMPTYGTFNLHASLLPQYRGAAPINWAIINGETKTGVTTFFIDEKIDTGAIILQDEAPIQIDDNVEDLHDRLMHLGAHTVIKTVERIQQGNFETTEQVNSDDLKEAHKIHRETCEIDWHQPKEDLYNFIRGLSPYPAAWTTLINGDQQIITKIYKASMLTEQHKLPIGNLVFTKKEMKVAVINGYLILEEIQLQGKKRMHVKDVLNGLNLEENAKMR
ncbi:methionyl-tRNA formyltransferase [Maribacter hydrothermalis]|uniref:Methionyl-tRNA formyltransferase n=1 Tax=Maribacter hydrothermalis TaxID=1836467 RepID=A0A1B7Z8Y2_9FLAO|nr:methionyl-tRNA formyltransferase [Maribacter hydrothermalis]APQ18819.1 methionyl-tRNA formyltransferase [Maribacter hydrothermalis]OBR39167.1 methionyl-tRNA formyltransferase [Maribacter hydrothermalis]